MKPPNDEGPDLAEGAPGKADATVDGDQKYTGNGACPQWVERTSADLVSLVATLRSMSPSSALPPYVQRALGRQWSAT